MPCEWILKYGTVPGRPEPFTQRCSADAKPGARYCPVHDKMSRGEPLRGPSLRPPKDLTRDELPWSDADRQAFGHTK